MQKNKCINLVTSFPKSGATWFRFIIYACYNGPFDRSADLGRLYPEIHQRKDYIEKCISESKEIFVKSHFPYFQSLPFQENIKRSIYIVRNPLDVMASKLNHFKLHGANKLNLDLFDKRFYHAEIENAFKKEYEIKESNVVGGWCNHVITWLKESPEEIRPYVVKYEDLVKQPLDTLKRMSVALDFGFSDKTIQTAIELSSFDNLKKIEQHELENEIPGFFYLEERKKNYIKKGIQFINKGSSGYYKDQIGQEIVNKAKIQFAEAMALVGYDLEA